MARGLVAGPDDYNRGFRRIVLSLISLVIVPTALLLVVGTVMLVFYDLRANLVFGLLVVTLVACLITGVVLALVFVRREANLSRLQLDFVSKVSHELRTPLTSIRMFVETLRYEHEPAKVDTCLDVLQRETERLSTRIERLLDWGRMEAGKRVYQLQPDDMSQVVAASIEHFRAATVGQQRQIELDLPTGLPPISADRGALEDALLNLLTNAHKYSPVDKPIAVRAFFDRNAVHVSVEDHGIGIARNEHHRVFEKFYRSDDRLSRSLEGSGLGLAIVQHVVQGHHGRVTLRSAPGRGSMFTISLPIGGTAPKAHRIETPRPPGATRERGFVSEAGKRLLLVEDDPSIVIGLRMNLEREGYEVELAEDGEQGLTRAKSGHFDLLILDIMLPKLNGYEVLNDLRKRGDMTPVLLLSARSAEMDKVMGLDLGADDYIPKPFSVAELLARVRAALRRGGKQTQAEGRWQMGDVEVDPARHIVRKAAREVELTAKEFEVLQLLKGARGRVLSRQMIFDHVWGDSHHGTLRTIDNFVSQLRSKLENDPAAPRHLLTVRGVGYRLDLSGSGESSA